MNDSQKRKKMKFSKENEVPNKFHRKLSQKEISFQVGST